MRTLKQALPSKSHLMAYWPRYLLDSVLACSGSLLITGVVFALQLYPRIPNITNVYVLLVLVLAITRGRYAAILSAVVASLSYIFFIVPPLNAIGLSRFEEWIALFLFLLVALLIGQLAIRQREQATRHERETRLLFEVAIASNQKAEQAHQRLLASEQAARTEAEAARARLYELFMQAPAAMAITRGPGHRYEFANPLVPNWDRAVILGKTVGEMQPKAVEQGILTILDEVYTTGRPFVGTEFPSRLDRQSDKAPEDVWYNVVCQALRTTQGDIDGLFIHGVEVTEQVQARRRLEELNRFLEAEKQIARQAQQEAEAQAAKLSAIFEAMSEAVAVYDTRADMRYINPAYRSLMELEEDVDPVVIQFEQRSEWIAVRDMAGKPLPKEQLPLMRLLRGERLSDTHSRDFMCRTFKGKELIVNASGAPIRGASGQITGGVIIFRDVTRQHELEQQLRFSEHKYRSLVESNIFGMIVSDTTGRIYEANDRFAQLVGYSKDELLAETFNLSRLKLPEAHEALGQVMVTLLSTGVAAPVEREYLRKDGSRVPVLVGGAMVDQERDILLAVILDISERKEVERRKQGFLSMVSHELRTPLQSIMGFVELALLYRDLLPSPLSPRVEELIGKIELVLKGAMRQVNIEARLVEELLDVSRLELHKFEVSVHPENLVTIVQETIATQQQMARTRHIELVLPPEEVVPVLVDAGRIGQALTNYLTNALKYAPVDQVVSVRLDVEVGLARVSVRDQGPGLTAEQQQRVWERFYQVAAPGLQGPEGGLGLGLAIAKAIVEQHQGQVGVQSAPGRGSTFWFSVPLAIGPIQS